MKKDLINLTKETKAERRKRLQSGFKPRPQIIVPKNKKLYRNRKHKGKYF